MYSLADLRLQDAAGIMAAKQTSQLIPLCHNIPLDKVNVELRLDSAQRCVHIEAMAKTQAYTGCHVMLGPTVQIIMLTEQCPTWLHRSTVWLPCRCRNGGYGRRIGGSAHCI